MTLFNRMTLASAARILSETLNQTTFSELCFEWEIEGLKEGSVRSKLTQIARIAASNEHLVITETGRKPLELAIVEKTLCFYDQIKYRHVDLWQQFKAGLRFDGFEVEGESQAGEHTLFLETPRQKVDLSLRRMLPEDVPQIDFRDAESELVTLLKEYQFDVSLGHLNQAFNNFHLGQWASANSDLRSFFEGLLNEIAINLGCDPAKKTTEKRQFLGTLSPPFLYEEYNEWNINPQKPQFVQGLWSRMHPHGSHPGLSEEDDCTFRVQITLISARLFLRRFDQRRRASLV